MNSMKMLALIVTLLSAAAGSEPVGPARAPLDPALLTDRVPQKSLAEIQKELTRSQKIIYESYYIDFYATLQTKAFLALAKKQESTGQTCFTIRVETDDSRVDSALKWETYLKRVGYADIRLDFTSYVFAPEAKYPLTYNAEACAPYVIDKANPIYLIAEPQFVRGLDPIRLEWTF